MADDDELEGTEPEDEGTPEPSGRPVTGWQRLTETFLRPPGPKTVRPQPAPQDLSHLTDAERRRRINQIDPTERKVGLAAGVLALVFSVVYTVPDMVSKVSVATTVKPVHKVCADHYKYTVNAGAAATCNTVYSTSHYVFELVFLLVFSAALLVTVRIGRRALMAFAIVICGLAFGTFLLLLPFLVAGGWLLLRAWRTQRYGSPTARAPVEGYVPPVRGAPRAPAGPRQPRNATRRGRAAPAAPEGKKPPAPSKRYTPKTQKKRRPPPAE
jgi:hypothetical protein